MSKTQQKETPQRNILEPFFLDTLKTTFWMENVNPKWTQSEPTFPKSGHLFWISKRSHLPPYPICAPVSVAEYTFLCLNLSKYPWKCLNELLWLCLGSEYAWSSYMFDKLLKMLVVLNKPGIWIWHACVFKGYAGFRICLIMDPYSSIMPKYASICLNVTQCAWAWLNILNVSEYA